MLQSVLNVRLLVKTFFRLFDLHLEFDPPIFFSDCGPELFPLTWSIFQNLGCDSFTSNKYPPFFQCYNPQTYYSHLLVDSWQWKIPFQSSFHKCSVNLPYNYVIETFCVLNMWHLYNFFLRQNRFHIHLSLKS